MKNSLSFLVTVLSSLLLTCCLNSCSDVGELHEEAEPVFSKDYLIPLSEALQNADQMFKVVAQENTRTGRKVKDFDFFQLPSTRNHQEPFHGFYVVNYEDGGFALLSADRRLCPVYALSENGSLSLSDTTENPGLSYYINHMMYSLHPDIPSGPDTTLAPVPMIPYNFYELYSHPLINGFMAKFHQNMPYNQYCNSGPPSFFSYVVGCGPLAIGTVMGYYEWPNNWNGYIFPWKEMKAQPYHSSWARLFETLGRKENTNAVYGFLATGTNATEYSQTFVNYGYSRPVFSYFKPSYVESELKSGNPIVVVGNYASSGHAWVIDGGYTTGCYQEPPIPGEEGHFYYTTYYHCIWGWEGKSNGYYLHYGQLSSGGLISNFGWIPDEGNDTPAEPYGDLMMIAGYRPLK